MIKEVYHIIPLHFRAALRSNLVIGMVNQILDFISVIVLLPVVLAIINPMGTVGNFHYNVPFTKLIAEHPIAVLCIVVVFFLIKNFISVKIIKRQSNYYYAVSSQLSLNLLENFLQKPFVEVKSEKNSTLIKDIVFIPNNFVSYVLSPLSQLLSDGFLIALIITGSAFINPLATLLLIAIAGSIVCGLYLYDRKKLNAINNEVEKKYNHNFSHLLNTVNGYIEIKTNRLEKYFLEKFSKSNSELNKIYSALTTNRLAKPKYTETFLIIIIAFLFVASKYIIKDHRLNVLFVSFLFAASIKIIPAINRILISLTNVKANLYTMEILRREARNFEPDRQAENELSFNDQIALKKISFGFHDSNPLLANAELTVKKGELVGIIGKSGIGKSTLINILTTLLEPDSGVVCCDGIAIGRDNNQLFLEKISYVPQMPFIMEGTIRDNLILAKNTTDERLLEIYLELFELDRIIDALPQKLETFIGSNGYNLSGGQLQRIAIIRALLRNPEILILDEALNQLDIALRQRIAAVIRQRAIEQHLTIITVSHNQSELANFCDHVYELRNGNLQLLTV